MDSATIMDVPPCPKCGVSLKPKVSLDDVSKGKPITITCDCGHKDTLIPQGLCQIEGFTWEFPSGRSITWNVSAMRDSFSELDPSYKMTTTIPLGLLRMAVMTNPTAYEDGEEGRKDNNLPIIAIAYPQEEAPDDPDSYLPVIFVDGWHRMMRAAKAGKTLEAWVVPTHVERNFRVNDTQGV